jgi:hypothetical protein
MSDEPMTAVEEPEAQTLEALQALIEAKEAEAKALTETLGEMWMQRQNATLPRERYPDYFFFEDQLKGTLRELDRLAPQLHYARAVDAITKAKAHYDHYCEPVAQQALRVCQDWTTFVTDCAVLVHLIDEQVSPLVILTRADGQPMFELDGGAQTLQNMLSAFPGQVMLAQTVIPRLHTPLTAPETRTILEHVKGVRAFSDTNVARYLAEYAYEEPKPDIPVEDV